jgi:hypothetical protein
MDIAEKRQLEALTFHIKKRKKETPNFDINLIKDLFKKFPDFLISLPSEEGVLGKNSVKIEKKTIEKEVKTSINISDGLLLGKISSTKYGIIIKLRDAKNKEIDEPSYESKPTEGVEKVFFFLIYHHESKEKGMILLERNGIYGINSVFITLLKSYFNEHFPDYIFKASTFIDRDIVKRIVKDGMAKSITLKSNRISRDNSDKLNIPEGSDDYTLELIIRKKNGYFSTGPRTVIKKLFDEKDKNYVISETLESIGFDSRSEVIVNFEYDDKSKKINLEESLRAPRSVYDIHVKVDKYGDSDFEAISKEAKIKFNLINPM